LSLRNEFALDRFGPMTMTVLIRRDSIADYFSVCFKVQTLLQLLVCKARCEGWGMRLFYSKG